MVHAVPNPGTLDLAGDAPVPSDTAAADAGGGGFTPNLGHLFTASYAWPLYNRATTSYKNMISGSLQRGDLWASSLSPENRADYFRALKDSVPTFSIWQYVKDEVLP